MRAWSQELGGFGVGLRVEIGKAGRSLGWVGYGVKKVGGLAGEPVQRLKQLGLQLGLKYELFPAGEHVPSQHSTGFSTGARRQLP